MWTRETISYRECGVVATEKLGFEAKSFGGHIERVEVQVFQLPLVVWRVDIGQREDRLSIQNDLAVLGHRDVFRQPPLPVGVLESWIGAVFFPGSRVDIPHEFC